MTKKLIEIVLKSLREDTTDTFKIIGALSHTTKGYAVHLLFKMKPLKHSTKYGDIINYYSKENVNRVFNYQKIFGEFIEIG